MFGLGTGDGGVETRVIFKGLSGFSEEKEQRMRRQGCPDGGCGPGPEGSQGLAVGRGVAEQSTQDVWFRLGFESRVGGVERAAMATGHGHEADGY